MKQRRLVVGDIHGAYKSLLQVFEKSNFNYKKDLLICLGDVADSWSEVPECIEELIKIKNLIYIIGNHDRWLIDYLRYGLTEYIWTSQGGSNTLKAYEKWLEKGDTTIIDRHLKFFNKGIYYHVTKDNKLFVHGGFDWHYPIEDQSNYDLMWDRHLWETVLWWKNRKISDKIKAYNEIFIGHTTTSRSDPTLKPINAKNVWNLDQGCGWEGKLTLMNVDTKEYWQSDITSSLYPNENGRK